MVIPVYKPTNSAADHEAQIPNDSTVPEASNLPARNSEDDLQDIFGDSIPVPMHTPSSAYGAGDRPWFYMDD